jgi:hypothetical protein
VSIFDDSDAPSNGGIAVIGQNSAARRAGSPSRVKLNSSASTVREKRYDRSNQKYNEQYFCDAGRSGRNATETK